VKLTVNGDAVTLAEEKLTVSALIAHLDLAGGPVAVERNGEVVPRADHASTELRDGDVVEIVHFVGGG
jgi:sulfur carrier protein